MKSLEKASIIDRSVVISGLTRRWPNGVVPFRINPNLPNQNRVNDAISHWQNNTHIRFVARTTENNFITFITGNECSSPVGMRGGEQHIIIGNNCSTGSTIHEIGHALGLWHEQSREDRNNFVTINFQNVEEGKEHNFNQHITDGDDIGEYDYCSIMHYGSLAFSKNTQPTITVLQPSRACATTIGQRNGLSDGDKSAIRSIYNIGQGVLYQFGANSIVGVGGYFDPVGQQHVVIVGTTDGKVYDLWWQGPNPATRELLYQFGANSIVGVGGYFDPVGQQHVVIVGTTDGKVYDLWWQGPNPATRELLYQFGANSIVGVGGYFDPVGQQHVVIVGTTDGKVYDLWWQGPNPATRELLYQFGANSIVGVGGYFDPVGQQHVVIVGTTDGKVYDLWWQGPNPATRELLYQFGANSIVGLGGYWAGDQNHHVIVGTTNGRDMSYGGKDQIQRVTVH